LAAPAAATAAPQSRSLGPKPVDSIIVVVNNEVITRQELADRMRLLQKRLTAQGVALPPRGQLERQLLERMIVERAQLQMAKENGIVVDDTMLDRALQRIAEQNKLSMADFRVQLEREGIAYSAFREDIRREIIMQRLREREVDNKVQISESEVDNYLAAESNASAQHEDYNLAQILVRVPENASSEQIAARRQRAEDVLRQLKSGGDFAKLAASYSDSSDALSGGDLGWRGQDRLPQLFLEHTVRDCIRLAAAGRSGKLRIWTPLEKVIPEPRSITFWSWSICVSAPMNCVRCCRKGSASCSTLPWHWCCDPN